jgi:predicted kinase
MSDLYYLVGAPASGKSTYAKELQKEGIKLVSSDDIRETLWGDASIQKNPKEVFKQMEILTHLYLAQEENVVYDATNISAARRKEFVKLVKSWNLNVDLYCIYLNIPMEVCIERNKERERKVPVRVIKRMFEQMEEPTYDEGWDFIGVLTLKGE